MTVAKLFITVKNWKQLKCPGVGNTFQWQFLGYLCTLSIGCLGPINGIVMITAKITEGLQCVHHEREKPMNSLVPLDPGLGKRHKGHSGKLSLHLLQMWTGCSKKNVNLEEQEGCKKLETSTQEKRNGEIGTYFRSKVLGTQR